MKKRSCLERIQRLRCLVGHLGSRKNAGWWDCSFMDETGIKFLSNAFPRSAANAAIQATSEAAQRAHDAALGRIGCFHLFRLPIQLEDQLSEIEPAWPTAPAFDQALAEIASLADALIDAPEGPVQLGVESRILTETSVRELAAHYHSAFSKQVRCFPYFSAAA